MKAYTLSVAVILFAACHNTPDKSRQDRRVSANNKSNSSKNKDSVVVYSEDSYTWKYGVEEMDTLEKQFPELIDKIKVNPDMAYAQASVENNDAHSFASEAGQDSYYILYGYYLKKQNGEEKYRQKREKLISLFRAINTIYSRLADGGTYFGHQHIRIIGYAEYTIYAAKNNEYYVKPYNINKQKQSYLESLSQYITDEIDNNNETSNQQKAKLKKELLQTVAVINGLITDYCYLECAREFQYSHY